MFSFLYRQTRDESVAEDLLQETWLAVVRNLNSFRRDCRFLNWCLRIAHNKMLDWWRRESSRGAGKRDSLDYTDPDTHEPYLLIPDPGPMIRQQYAPMFEVLERLPAECQKLLTLHYVGGLSLEEIREVLQLGAIGTVSAKISRCLEKARKFAQ